MKALLIFVFGIGIVSLMIYALPAYRQKAIQLLSYSECDTPLPYKIGTIDSRFNLSKDEVRSDIREATDIWSNAERKELFAYSSTADLTVNFVYDNRQALNTQINQLNSKLQQNNTTLQQQVDDYKVQVSAFNQKITSFKATVEKYNSEGGAPPEIYSELIKEQNELKSEADALNARAKELKLSTNDYNANVSVLNQDINQFNTALAQKPEEGLYNGKDNTITIYFATNQQEFLHTLAHEFGHSLGMEHVTDRNGIMYPYVSNSLEVTQDDMQQLSFVCREQSVIVHYSQKFDSWFLKEIQSLQQNFSH